MIEKKKIFHRRTNTLIIAISFLLRSRREKALKKAETIQALSYTENGSLTVETRNLCIDRENYFHH